MKTTKQQQLISLAQKIGFDQAIMRLGGVGSESADLFKGREADDNKTKDGGRSLGDCAHSPDKAEDNLEKLASDFDSAAKDRRQWALNSMLVGDETQENLWLMAAVVYEYCSSRLKRSLSESRRGSVASVPANV